MSQLALMVPSEPVPSALFSRCTTHHICDPTCPGHCVGRRFRYRLRWPTGAGSGAVLFCLANPSKATHLKTDPTVAKCIGYARRWGYAECWIANVRAWRETDPRLVPADPDGIGPFNDRHIAEMASAADLVVCGWGKLGGARGAPVLHIIRHAAMKTPHALKLNQDGSPQHPLYLKNDATPFPMPEPERTAAI